MTSRRMLAPLSSPDELSVYIARRLMQQESPSLLWITMHDIDIAHAGAYSLYIDGIRRTDRLCAELWKAVQSEPEYAGNTTLFILPDFGRDADEDSGGNGFQHHRTGDAASRTTWMMALGAGVRQGVVYDRPMQSIDLVPTSGSDDGILCLRFPKASRSKNWCSRHASTRSQSRTVRRVSSPGAERWPWPTWTRCDSFRSAFCPACCAR